jgi:hypothetical protein
MPVPCLYLSSIPKTETKYSSKRLILARMLIVAAVITRLRTFIDAEVVSERTSDIPDTRVDSLRTEAAAKWD